MWSSLIVAWNGKEPFNTQKPTRVYFNIVILCCKKIWTVRIWHKWSRTVKALIENKKFFQPKPCYLLKNNKGRWKKRKKLKKKKEMWQRRGLQAERCEAEKGTPRQGRWWMRFRLQARPAAPSGVDSTLTLIMLGEIPRTRADERKHAT